jgi:hypothetical protein
VGSSPTFGIAGKDVFSSVFSGFSSSTPIALPSVSVKIRQNRRLWAKEWAKGNLPSIGPRGGQRFVLQSIGAKRRQGIDGGG